MAINCVANNHYVFFFIVSRLDKCQRESKLKLAPLIHIHVYIIRWTAGHTHVIINVIIYHV